MSSSDTKSPNDQSQASPSDPSMESKNFEEEKLIVDSGGGDSEKMSKDGGGEGKGEGEGAEDDEEGECGFCLFMKGGGCRDSFIAWEKCIEEAEENKEDVVEKCFEVTGTLKKCMEAHSDYYEPILRAEKAAEAEVREELDKEAAAAAIANSTEDTNKLG